MTDTTVKNNETTQKESDESTSKGDIKHIGYAGLIARRFFRQRSAVVGLIILLVLVFFALFGANIGKWAYDDPDFLALSAGPSASHWLGTDSGGSDLYAMVVRGLGKSLMIGIITSVATMAIASLLGTAISFFGGWVERVGMWLLDMLLVVPSFLLIAMIVRTANATTGWIWLIIGLTAFGWVGYARIIRTLTLSLRERDYVKAARFMGVGSFKIIVHAEPRLDDHHQHGAGRRGRCQLRDRTVVPWSGRQGARRVAGFHPAVRRRVHADRSLAAGLPLHRPGPVDVQHAADR